MGEYFKSPEYLQELKSLDLGIITRELEKYNRQFGLGATMARAILTPLEDDPEQRFTEESESESQQAFLDRIKNQYGILLDKSGISMELVKGGGTILTGDEKIEANLLQINLLDRKQFLAYLSALKANSITPSQIEGLKKVAESLQQQLEQQYHLDKPDPRAAELLGNLQDKDIVEQYQRLDPKGENGLAQAVKQLSDYMDKAKAGYLKEYLSVQRANLLSEVGGMNFGPSQWHADSNEKSYPKYWQRALEELEKIKQNPNAMELYIQVSQHLVESANYAKKALEQNKQNYSHAKDKIVTIEQVLKTLRKFYN